jgi:hypothetical protein
MVKRRQALVKHASSEDENGTPSKSLPENFYEVVAQEVSSRLCCLLQVELSQTLPSDQPPEKYSKLLLGFVEAHASDSIDGRLRFFFDPRVL